MASAELPWLRADGPWHAVLDGPERARLEAALPGFLAGRRWFGGKARTIRRVELLDAPALGASGAHRLALLRVAYVSGAPETYSLPLGFAGGERAARIRSEIPGAALAEVDARDASGLLYASDRDPAFAR